MARRARVVVAGMPHHVTQRGLVVSFVERESAAEGVLRGGRRSGLGREPAPSRKHGASLGRAALRGAPRPTSWPRPAAGQARTAAEEAKTITCPRIFPSPDFSMREAGGTGCHRTDAAEVAGVRIRCPAAGCEVGGTWAGPGERANLPVCYGHDRTCPAGRAAADPRRATAADPSAPTRPGKAPYAIAQPTSCIQVTGIGGQKTSLSPFSSCLRVRELAGDGRVNQCPDASVGAGSSVHAQRRCNPRAEPPLSRQYPCKRVKCYLIINTCRRK